jgi:chromate reductase
MDGKPVGWINIAAGAGEREDHLAMVLRYVGALAADGACVRLPVPREAIGPDGTVADAAIRDRLAAVLAALTR